MDAKQSGWIDTHCHLNTQSLIPSLSQILARARENGVEAMIVPAYDMESFPLTAKVSQENPQDVYPAFGIHPWYIPEKVDYDKIVDHCKRYDAVAVGEIGLDFSPECPSKERQIEILRQQLDIAIMLNLPVLLHTRKAHDAIYPILKEYQGRLTGVLHSFGGGADLASGIIKLGFYISFSGSLTWKNARKYHKMAKEIPLEWILVETDSPCIGTATTQASDVEPKHVVEIGAKIAEIKGISIADVAVATTGNARNLFWPGTDRKGCSSTK